MNKKQCRDALDLYKKFLIRMDRVAEFLKVAEVCLQQITINMLHFAIVELLKMVLQTTGKHTLFSCVLYCFLLLIWYVSVINLYLPWNKTKTSDHCKNTLEVEYLKLENALYVCSNKLPKGRFDFFTKSWIGCAEWLQFLLHFETWDLNFIFLHLVNGLHPHLCKKIIWVRVTLFHVWSVLKHGVFFFRMLELIKVIYQTSQR